VAHVLIVEDDPRIRTLLMRSLGERGHAVASASTGMQGLNLALETRPQLVVLDLGLPDVDGAQVLSMLRAVSQVPVIVATARDDDPSLVACLDAGADDYVVKPFSFSELLARLRARLRNPDQPSPVVLDAGGIRLDVRTREATVAGREIALSSREFALLEVLLRHPGQILSQTQLLDLVWGYDFEGASNVVETYIRHLRRKIGSERIETVRRAGYRVVTR
jgi:DNA-binding response OmpR family regulator